MKRVTDKIGVVQNTGLYDRAIRIIIGAFLLGGAVVHMEMGGGLMSWHAYAGLISIYPFLTGILGWDPFYSLFHTKTCDLSEKNRCGTFPYQVDAAMGHNPIPDQEFDHSLTGSHHKASGHGKKAA